MITAENRNLTDEERRVLRDLAFHAEAVLKRLDLEAEATDRHFPCQAYRDDIRQTVADFRHLFGYSL
ncbi:hypothetical protein [Thalassoroseus pseudoceratinae]|uniref:hypothetical protein n=1 Tax=Thalassoroseus pseudoceratinae TaxID=2713176 RepID=UPI001421553D|nr:hypothetical protein [Thalassoroseus pseudoceratinae]